MDNSILRVNLWCKIKCAIKIWSFQWLSLAKQQVTSFQITSIILMMMMITWCSWSNYLDPGKNWDGYHWLFITFTGPSHHQQVLTTWVMLLLENPTSYMHQKHRQPIANSLIQQIWVRCISLSMKISLVELWNVKLMQQKNIF